MHPDDRDLVWKAVKDAIESRSPYAAEFRVLWSTGTVRWVAAKGQFHYSSGGDPERMLGMAVDITERKDAEESLRRKEVELKEAQRLAGVGSWQWDPDTDTVMWSEELYRIAGRDPGLPAVTYKEHSQLYTARELGAAAGRRRNGASHRRALRTRSGDGPRRRHAPLGQGTRRGPARFQRPHRAAARHGSGHHGAQAGRRRAVQRESAVSLRPRSRSAPGSPGTCTTTSVSASPCWR